MLNNILVITVFCLLLACSSDRSVNGEKPTNDQVHLTITGSSTLAPLIAEIARYYETLNPGTRIDVQTGGSSRGIADIEQGVADIGMVSKHIASTDKMKAHLVARDGVTLVVHKDNPLSSLVRKNIEDIYLGRINHWNQLGINKTDEIVVVSKAEGRSTLSVFLNYLQKRNSDLKPDIIIGDNEQAIKLVSNNVNAIAYVSTSTAEYNIEQGIPIKSLIVDEVQPTETNIVSGVFPIVRELNLVTTPSIDKPTSTFIQFVQNSSKAHTLIKDFHFVPAS